ncbi:MAG TPA: GGDEF domain-containing protein [Firmicutes bacterium]|nr:GGDEF domain-containing protein [Bacillota bacterium]
MLNDVLRQTGQAKAVPCAGHFGPALTQLQKVALDGPSVDAKPSRQSLDRVAPGAALQERTQFRLPAQLIHRPRPPPVQHSQLSFRPAAGKSCDCRMPFSGRRRTWRYQAPLRVTTAFGKVWSKILSNSRRNLGFCQPRIEKCEEAIAMQLNEAPSLKVSRVRGDRTLKVLPYAVLSFALLPLLHLLQGYNYLLFHTSVEVFRVIVATHIFAINTRTYRFHGNPFLYFIGAAFLSVAALNFLHLVTYHGMNLIGGLTPNEPTQFWIAQRYVEALSFAVAPSFLERAIKPATVVLTMLSVTAAVTFSILGLKVFPACFVDGVGLTAFKIVSEYLICGFFVVGLYRLHRRRASVGDDFFAAVCVAVGFNLAAELSFTLYKSVYDVFNFAGHVFAMGSSMVLYQGTVLQALDSPYDLIFNRLRSSAVTDSLTGLNNRQGFLETVQHKLSSTAPGDDALGLLMIDLDNFKSINDRYGHLAGDEALKGFANLLKGAVRKNDLAFRFGGDEFLVLLAGAAETDLELVKNRIRQAFVAWTLTDPRLSILGVSIGGVIWRKKDGGTLEQALSRADKDMYSHKADKRSQPSQSEQDR